jgi:hypothetical protein
MLGFQPEAPPARTSMTSRKQNSVQEKRIAEFRKMTTAHETLKLVLGAIAARAGVAINFVSTAIADGWSFRPTRSPKTLSRGADWHFNPSARRFKGGSSIRLLRAPHCAVARGPWHSYPFARRTDMNGGPRVMPQYLHHQQLRPR